MQIAIIGDGPAGQSAAEALLKINPEIKLSLFTEEPIPFYSRMKLVEYLDDRVSRDGLVIRKPEWYAERHVELHLAERVEALNSQERRFRTSKGKYEYEKLLLATGSSAFCPPFPGHDLDGVITLRNVEDADDLKARANAASHGVVIGGGILGLEAAASLVTLNPNLTLTVVDTNPWLLSRQLDEAGAGLLQGFLEEKGLTFRLQASVKGILGEKAVQAVALENEQLPADFVLVCAGIRNRLELAKMAGLECGRGILVDDHLRTSDPNIFAAGDVAEFQGKCLGLWKPAMDQGVVAGKNLVGQETVYQEPVISNKLKVTGIEIASVGDFDPEGALAAKIRKEPGQYQKIVYNEAGEIVGGILIGDTRPYQSLIQAATRKTTIAQWEATAAG